MFAQDTKLFLKLPTFNVTAWEETQNMQGFVPGSFRRRDDSIIGLIEVTIWIFSLQK